MLTSTNVKGETLAYTYDQLGRRISLRTLRPVRRSDRGHAHQQQRLRCRHLWSDLNNTAAWQVQNTTSAVTTQRTTPYGAPRDMATRFASDRGFVQGLNDPALGMIRIGARDYDPATGRFLQPDPILDASSSSTQWNAYGYGNNNPTDQPDPTGLRPDDMDGQMYTRYLQVFNGSKKKGYSHSQSQVRANNAAYNTPSGRAGGVSFRQRYGVVKEKYDPVDAERQYNSRRAWASKTYTRTNYRTGIRGAIDNFKKTIFTAFRPMNGAQAAAGLAGWDSPAYTDQIMTDPAFAEQMGAQSELALDIHSLIGTLTGSGARSLAVNGARAATAKTVNIGRAKFAQKSFSETFDARGRFAGRTIDDVAGDLRSGAMS